MQQVKPLPHQNVSGYITLLYQQMTKKLCCNALNYYNIYDQYLEAWLNCNIRIKCVWHKCATKITQIEKENQTQQKLANKSDWFNSFIDVRQKTVADTDTHYFVWWIRIFLQHVILSYGTVGYRDVGWLESQEIHVLINRQNGGFYCGLLGRLEVCTEYYKMLRRRRREDTLWWFVLWQPCNNNNNSLSDNYRFLLQL